MLTLQPGEIFADNYKLVRLIDTGGFAEVWEAIFLTAGNTVALKIYPRLDAEGVKNIEDEYLNQAELSHSHLLIARYFGKFNGYPFLEMRYCSGGNASARLGAYQEKEVARCIVHIASALAYLHENDVVHQDVKPNNFLLDSRNNYYLADLGLSLRVRSTIRKYTQTKSNKSDSIYAGLTPPAYRGPELYDRTSTGGPIMASDIWALGASLFEMITGDVPLGEFGGLMQINSPEPPDLPDGFSVELNYIIKKCLSKETWDRPRAAELVQWVQPYLEGGAYGVKVEKIKIVEPRQDTLRDDTGKDGQHKGDANKGGTNSAGGTIRDNQLHDGQQGQYGQDQHGQGQHGQGQYGHGQHGQGQHGQGNQDQPKPVPKPNRTWWAVVAVVVILAGFGIKWIIDRNTAKASTAVVLPKDTTVILKKDSPQAKPVDSTRTKTDTTIGKQQKPGEKGGINDKTDKSGTNDKTGTDKSNIGTDKPERNDPLATPASIVISYPSIRTRPRSGSIDIVRVEKTDTRLNITFRIKSPNGKSNISIYGPEDPDHCFYILAGGNKYRLQAIDKKGKGLSVSDGYTFTTSFHKIPESVRTITVMEGEDQDNPDQTYWNFYDVNVVKQ